MSDWRKRTEELRTRLQREMKAPYPHDRDTTLHAEMKKLFESYIDKPMTGQLGIQIETEINELLSTEGIRDMGYDIAWGPSGFIDIIGTDPLSYYFFKGISDSIRGMK